MTVLIDPNETAIDESPSTALASTGKKKTATRRSTSGEPIWNPFTVAVDQREQHPWSFTNIVSDADQHRRTLLIPLQTKRLASGDYSILGWESRVAIERKSLDDLYGTIGRERDRFIRELERLDQMEFAAVVVEAGLGRVIGSPPERTKTTPKTITRSVMAWQQRYRGVHWVFAPDRRIAEVWAFQSLRRFWMDRQQGGFFDAANATSNGR